MLVLTGSCLLFSLQARPDYRQQAVTAPERPLIIPAMKAGAACSGYAVLISGSSVETVSLERIPPQSAPKPKARLDVCLDPWERR